MRRDFRQRYRYSHLCIQIGFRIDFDIWIFLLANRQQRPSELLLGLSWSKPAQPEIKAATHTDAIRRARPAVFCSQREKAVSRVSLRSVRKRRPVCQRLAQSPVIAMR